MAAFITPLHLLGRRGIRPRFSDQDVGLILVASIEHSWLLRGAAKPDDDGSRGASSGYTRFN